MPSAVPGGRHAGSCGFCSAVGAGAAWRGEVPVGGAWTRRWLARAFQEVFEELRATVEAAGGARTVHGTILASPAAALGGSLADGAKPVKRIAAALQRVILKRRKVQLGQLLASQPGIPESVAARNVDREAAILLTVNPTATTVLAPGTFGRGPRP